MDKELREIITEAVAMYHAGKSIAEIRTFLESKKPLIANGLLYEVAENVGISYDELIYKTGDSFGVSRFQRPRNTYDLIVVALLGLFTLYKKDVTKVNRELRADSVVAGVKTGKTFFSKYVKAVTAKAKRKLLDTRLGDILNGAFKVRLFRRSGMISKRYLDTETSHVKNYVQRKLAKLDGKQYLFIPKTAHGHSDNCRPFEGKYWGVDSGVRLPPYHVNCKHYVVYLDELPKYQKTSDAEIANDRYIELTPKPKSKK